MIKLSERIIIQTQKGKSTGTTVPEFLRLIRENQSQIVYLNTYKDQITQTKEEDNVTTKTLHFSNLLFNDPSIMTEWTDMDR